LRENCLSHQTGPRLWDSSVTIEKFLLEGRFKSFGNRALKVADILTKLILRLTPNSSELTGLHSVTVYHWTALIFLRRLQFLMKVRSRDAQNLNLAWLLKIHHWLRSVVGHLRSVLHWGHFLFRDMFAKLVTAVSTSVVICTGSRLRHQNRWRWLLVICCSTNYWMDLEWM
jgi:hypothetical protein